ncbi:TetR/AcrR family transcriptional regulator [Pseudoalteromonas piscicida]|uniref:TetR/AcrR family transcriptional regulator n=1 Tax=Pseudoalteromonas piscicida TaxID=43662 RepID=UPI001D0AC320|nr:TetR/AcrR family transcriptional regulator [Pseudoalteromonas piscicida]UDM62322.1 TetR/AcrR family transcriptional regulator [Pseudoalteromonas piscicida]
MTTRSSMMEKTRSELLAQARVLFASKGFAGTALEELTADVGLTRGALYHHFGNKKGLFYAVVQQLDSEMDLRLRGIERSETSPQQALLKRAETYLDMATEPEIQRIILRDAQSVLEPEQLEKAASGCVASITQLLSAIAPQQSPQARKTSAQFINGGLTSLALWIANHQVPDQAVDDAKRTAYELLNRIMLA